MLLISKTSTLKIKVPDKIMFYKEISVQSHKRIQWIDITSEVQKVIKSYSITNGVTVISSLHTTAGITINENADPDVGRDFFWKLNQLIPQDPSYYHSEGNSDSHLKASLIGLSVQIPVINERCVLGTWQSIYFCEFDGPRNRRVSVSVLT